jgi:WD40 repeat protein
MWLQVDTGAAAQAAQAIPAALTQAVVDNLTVVWKAKTKQRKARTIPTDLTKPDDISAWSTAAAAAHTLHKTNPAGITSLAISEANPDLTLTGGVDKSVILFNRATGTQQAVMTGHTKKVLDVGFSLNGEFLLSSSADGTAKVFNYYIILYIYIYIYILHTDCLLFQQQEHAGSILRSALALHVLSYA